MRILFVLEYYYPNIGGVETLFKSLTEALVKQEHQVLVITSRFDKSLAKREVINGVEVRRLPAKNRWQFPMIAVYHVLKAARDFDLIQTTSYVAGIPAVIAGKLKRRKTVITFHELWGKLWFDLPFRNGLSKLANYLVEQFIARLPYAHYIAVSEATKQRLIENGIAPKKVSRIYNGIDYNNFPKQKYNPPGQFTFTYFGRLGISKGLDILIDGAALFFRDHHNTRLKLIIPSIPATFHKKIKKMIGKQGITDQVTILSNLEKVMLVEELCSSHCVVIPSYSEGFCFSAAEAVALNIPLIHSGRGALPEVIGGKHIQMKALDAESLKEALISASEGKWNDRPIKKLELEPQVEAYLQLYKTLI